MKSTFIVMAASALIAVPLYAQEVDVTGSSPSAPASPADNAFEITFGLGYAQGFGDIGAGQPSLMDQITAGGELQLGLGWRCLRARRQDPRPRRSGSVGALRWQFR